MNTLEVKVGTFVFICILLIVGMSFRAANDPSVGGGKRYRAVLEDANGVVKNSVVRMAGIPVGTVKDVQLDSAGRAYVTMSIKTDVPLTQSAEVELRANGILGDKHIEVLPGNPKDALIPEDGMILIVKDKGSFDAILKQVGKVAADLSVVTENLKNATSGEGDDSTTIGRILLNIEDLTADLRDITSDKKGDIESTIDHIHNVAKSLDNFINDESPDGFKYNFKKMSKSLGKVDSILTNVDEITGKINTGKGTIGKLVNDESTVEELNKAISGVNNMLDKAGRFELTVDYHSELLANSMVKSYIGVSIQPGPDRFYNVAVVSDPKGSVEHVDQVSSANGATPTTLQNRTVYHEKLKFSIQFGKNFYDLAVRAGLFESTAGIGVDYHLFNRKLRLTSELFDFARTEGPNLRAFVRWKFYSVFYAVAGGDDIMNTKSNINGTGASGFLGAGLDFTNDDLKLLLGKVGF